MVMMTPARIRALRKALGLTQTQFAVMLNVTQNTIARWELGLSHPNYARHQELNDIAVSKGVKLPDDEPVGSGPRKRAS